MDWRNQAVICWGGLRALPIGLAISLDQNFPDRQIIIGLTLERSVVYPAGAGHHDRTVDPPPGFKPADAARGIDPFQRAGGGAARGVARLGAGLADADAARRELESNLQTRLNDTEREIQKFRAAHALTPESGKLRMFWLQLNNIELQAMRALLEEGVIGGNALRRLEREAERRNEDIGPARRVLPKAGCIRSRTLGDRAMMRLPEHALQRSGRI